MADRAPRIDTVRNQIAATIELLQLAAAQLEDLHVLAYDRQRAGEQIGRTTTLDYALDTHGDPRARNAYRRLAGALIAHAQPLAIASHDIIGILNDGERPGPNRQHPRTATAAEIADAIAAQARRITRGEYTPHRRHPQPRPGL